MGDEIMPECAYCSGRSAQGIMRVVGKMGVGFNPPLFSICMACLRSYMRVYAVDQSALVFDDAAREVVNALNIMDR